MQKKLSLTVLSIVLMALSACATSERSVGPETENSESTVPPPAEVAEITTYDGPDRTERLVQGAKDHEEFVITVYHVGRDWQFNPVFQAFTDWLKDEHHLEVDIDTWRAPTDRVATRALLEYQGGLFAFDVVEAHQPELRLLAREGVLTPYWSPHFDEYPEGYRDEHGYWHDVTLNTIEQVYNPDLLSPDQLPQTWHDLLDPKWRGKLGGDNRQWEWMGTLVKSGALGSEEEALEFFEALGNQEIVFRDAIRASIEMVSLEEVAYSLHAYNFHTLDIKDAGGPVERHFLEPLVSVPRSIGIAAKAHNPHLAALLVDFFLSEQGQTLLGETVQPANPKIDSRFAVDAELLFVEESTVTEEADHWRALWEELVLQTR